MNQEQVTAALANVAEFPARAEILRQAQDYKYPGNAPDMLEAIAALHTQMRAVYRGFEAIASAAAWLGGNEALRELLTEAMALPTAHKVEQAKPEDDEPDAANAFDHELELIKRLRASLKLRSMTAKFTTPMFGPRQVFLRFKATEEGETVRRSLRAFVDRKALSQKPNVVTMTVDALKRAVDSLDNSDDWRSQAKFKSLGLHAFEIELSKHVVRFVTSDSEAFKHLRDQLIDSYSVPVMSVPKAQEHRYTVSCSIQALETVGLMPPIVQKEKTITLDRDALVLFLRNNNELTNRQAEQVLSRMEVK